MSVIQFKATTSTGGRGGLRGIPRGLWMIASLLLLTVFTILAFIQSLRPDPLQAGSFTTIDWWFYPLERNPHKRLPEIKSGLNAIFASSDDNLIWAVGDRGLIVHSGDGGHTWIQQKIEVRAGSAGAEDRSSDDLPAPESTQPPAPSPQKQKSMRERDPYRQHAQRELTPVDYREEPGERDSESVLYPNSTPQVSYALYLQQDAPELQQDAPEPQSQKEPTAQAADSKAKENRPSPPPSGDPKQQPPLQKVQPPAPTNSPGPDAKGKSTSAPARPVTGATPRPAGATPSPGPTPRSSTTGAGTITITEDLIAVHFADAQRGWTFSRQGTLFATTDGGNSWYRPKTSRSTRQFAPLTYASINDSGQVVDFSREAEPFELYRFDESQQKYLRIPRDSKERMGDRSIPGRSSSERYSFGNDGSLISTTDDGSVGIHLIRRTTEEDQSSAAGDYSRWPAPWYYLSCLFCGLLLVPALKSRPEDAVIVEESIADLGVSDRPIEAGDPDPLKFNPIAMGLSRFIRNEKTLPPLTIAIIGAWGSGKSSLMNLLRADLRKYSFRPVWFNAWHHQKEDHLLASLLQNVRLQSVPSWLTFEGLGFRIRLLLIRGWRHWVPVLALLLVFAFSLSYAWNHPSALEAFGNGLDEAILSGKSDQEEGSWDGLLALIELPAAMVREGSLLALVASSIGIILSALRGSRAFGVTPASLMASFTQGMRLKDLNKQTSFRKDFAQEFEDVTNALGARPLAIFIDDLDRCRPDNMLDVLEAVNFLVSSGSCYIVMGMDRDRVERCVGLSFKEVAEEMGDGTPSSEGTSAALTAVEDGGDTGRGRRVQYARQYLDKLINIEVPLPALTADQTRELLVTQPFQAPSGGRSAWQMFATRLWPLLLAVLVIGFGIIAGRYLGQSRPPTSQMPPQMIELRQTSATEGASQTAPPRGATNAPASSRATAPAPDASNMQKGGSLNDQRPELIQPSPVSDYPSFWPITAIVLLLAVAIAWFLRQREDLVVKDSPEFEKALQIWHPLIYNGQSTPRSIKRFVNRVRYLAMRQRPVYESRTRWQELVAGVERRFGLDLFEASPEDNALGMPESVLVTLAAMQNISPAWLRNEQLLQDGAILNMPISSKLQFQDENEKDAWVYFQSAKAEHIKVFNNWVLVNQCRDAFLKLSAGIRVN